MIGEDLAVAVLVEAEDVLVDEVAMVAEEIVTVAVDLVVDHAVEMILEVEMGTAEVIDQANLGIEDTQDHGLAEVMHEHIKEINFFFKT